MKKNLRSHLVALTILLIPVIYLAVVYPTLPASIALHFGKDGKPDRYGDKSELLLGLGIILFVSVGIYFLMRNIHKIDPKKFAKYNEASMQKMAIGMILFFSALSILIISSAVTSSFSSKILIPLIGLFISYLGNLMHAVKPNYFFGVRSPWALEDEDNWRLTHRLAGKLWFAGGLLLTILSLIMGEAFSMYILFVLIMTLSLIPLIYSFIIFRRKQKLTAKHN